MLPRPVLADSASVTERQASTDDQGTYIYSMLTLLRDLGQGTVEDLNGLATRKVHPVDLMPGVGISVEAGDVLRGLVATAIGAHPRYKGALAKRREVAAVLEEARAGWQPRVAAGVTGGVAFFDGDEGDNRASTAGEGATTEADAFVSGSQLIYDFGATDGRVSAAMAAGVGVEAELGAAAAAIGFDAIAAFLDVRRSRIQVALADENLEIHRLILGFAEERRAAGVGTDSDVVRAGARLAGAEADRVQIEQALQEASSRYRELFGDLPDDEAPGLPPVLAIEPESVEAAVALAQDNAAPGRVARAETDRRRFERDAAEAGRWPSLNLQVRATRFDVLEGSQDVELTGRLVAQVDLYTGGAAAARVAQANERLNQAARSEDGARRVLERDTRIAFSDMSSRRRQLESVRTALEQNHRARLSILQQFRLRGASLIDVLGTQDDYFVVARRYVDTLVDAQLAAWRLAQVTGVLVAAFDVTQP